MRGIDRKKPSPVEGKVTRETAKHGKLRPAIIRNSLRCVAGQQHSIEKQKTKGIFFYTGELSRLVELFHF